MKLPILPIIISCSLLIGAVYLVITTTSEKRTFGAAHLERLADLEGTETEVAIAPDGTRLIAVASGDLWLLNTSDGTSQRLTDTPEEESSPAWTPDGGRLTFTRGEDTFAAGAGDLAVAEIFKENATSMTWSGTGRLAFVRERGLWLTDAGGAREHEVVPADPSPQVTLRHPRFSPDSLEIAFIKTTEDLHGEVWLADAASGQARPLVADRVGENPIDVGWLEGGDKLVYLTNRSGAFALWVFDLNQSILMPLTNPLDGVLLKPVGITVWGDRIILPRHLVDSDIVLSDGTVVAATDEIEFQPAGSRSGNLIAYTVQRGNKFEVWTAQSDGKNPVFRGLGMEPRFSANDFQIVYTYTDVQGRVDIRTTDIRDGRSTNITDAPEIDFQADWSPDGRTIAFASQVNGRTGLWAVSAAGGKRLRLADAGYHPRFSPDGRSLLFWNEGSLWSMPAAGGEPRQVRTHVPGPVPAAWFKGMPKYFEDSEINGGREIWPQFDVLKDGRLVIAPIEVRETSLWAVNLTYVEN